MHQLIKFRGNFLATLVFCHILASGTANATIVEFQTVMGDFQVNLYDNGTPQTVANFLNYVNGSAYSDSVVHRSESGFVIQGGGFMYDPNDPNTILPPIPANAPVANEPVFANVRGSIAMARPPTGVDTATNQWFINLGNNAPGLDPQDFAVFGEVVGSGMDVVDAIAALPTFAFDSPFNQIPLTNYTNDDFNNGTPVDDTHLIIISAVIVTDSTVDSAGAAGLNPPANTTPVTPPPPPPTSGGSGGGGSVSAMLLFAMLLVRYRRRRVAQYVVRPALQGRTTTE